MWKTILFFRKVHQPCLLFRKFHSSSVPSFSGSTTVTVHLLLRKVPFEIFVDFLGDRSFTRLLPLLTIEASLKNDFMPPNFQLPDACQMTQSCYTDTPKCGLTHEVVCFAFESWNSFMTKDRKNLVFWIFLDISVCDMSKQSAQQPSLLPCTTATYVDVNPLWGLCLMWMFVCPSQVGHNEMGGWAGASHH